MRSIAIGTRMVAIEQLGRYRRGAGAVARKVSDQIIEPEFSEAHRSTPVTAPLLAPDQG